ncbi:BMP-binding endothelial regulator protein-like [Saccoglossus kowalevskii]|uniref:IgGFc-binding protein-like n=1 Tax=Saccoglossus kowalevskii TaxID=10224 RepID=A0ABM0LXT7_SACKO|nr:PREDICTED: IgGFc-binding protein-like [Saccoglossus kowalevskii]
MNAASICTIVVILLSVYHVTCKNTWKAAVKKLAPLQPGAVKHAKQRRTVDCYNGPTGTDYRGTFGIANGKPCLVWSSNVNFLINPTTYPNKGLEGEDNAYCRNPDNDFKPWCYTSNITGAFAYCDFVDCDSIPPTTQPPTPPPGGYGDPHMTTFDALKYDFQGFCNYVLVKDCHSTEPRFKISADFRGRNKPNKPPTRMVAITITAKGLPTIRFLENNSFLINGKLYNGTEAVTGHKFGSVVPDGGTLLLNIPRLKLAATWNGKPHKITINLGDSDMHGKVCGLLGNSDGNPDNDFIKPDGTMASDAKEFGDSWAVPGSCV